MAQQLNNADDALNVARARATQAANVVATSATIRMRGIFAATATASAIGGTAGLLGSGTSILVGSNPVMGVLLLLGGTAFFVHLSVSLSNFSDAIITINHQMTDTVFGGADAYTSRQVIDNQLMDQGLWNLLTVNAQQWQNALQQQSAAIAAARAEFEMINDQLDLQQEDLNRRRQECEDAQQARQDELEQQCIDNLNAP